MAKLSSASELAKSELQAIKLRLQSLQTQFLHIDSPAELADAEREGGHILAMLLHGKHIEPDSLLLNARDILLDYAAGALATRTDYGLPFDDGLAQHYQLSLWGLVAMSGSDHQRVILHDAGPAPTWTVTRTVGTTTDTQKTDTGVRRKTTDRAKDFRQQGKRYSMLVSELIPKLSTEQPNGSPDARGKQGYSTSELAIAIGGVIADDSPDWTAKAVADEINRKCPDRTVGSTKVGQHPVFTDYKARFGRRRNRNTGKPKTITTSGDILDNLANQTRRKTKPLNPDDRDDGY